MNNVPVVLTKEQIAKITHLECDMQDVLETRFKELHGAIPPDLLGNEMMVRIACVEIGEEADKVTGYANSVTYKARVANGEVYFTVSIHPTGAKPAPNM